MEAMDRMAMARPPSRATERRVDVFCSRAIAIMDRIDSARYHIYYSSRALKR